MLNILFLTSLIIQCSGQCSETNGRFRTAVDTAINLLSTAKNEHPPGSGNRRGAMDCADIFQNGQNISGVHEIWPVHRMVKKPIEVFCDFATGVPWTYIARKTPGSEEYFDRDWESYKKGFGNVQKDFWIGNDNINILSNQKEYIISFSLKLEKARTSYVQECEFWIDNEFTNYTLHYSGCSNAALGKNLFPNNLMAFSTKDRDNDQDPNSNCAEAFRYGWWYSVCAVEMETADEDTSLTEIKIKPVDS